MSKPAVPLAAWGALCSVPPAFFTASCFAAAIASGLRSFGLIPAPALPWLQSLAHFLIVLALTGVGLGAELRQMLATGPRPILLGLGVWVAVAASSLLVQQVVGKL